MRDHKKEDQKYLNQFKDKTVGELLDILSTEADKLKSLIKGMLDRSKDTKNGKN